MAFEIIWSKQAENGFDKIINYLLENWTERELIKFLKDVDAFFGVLSQHPQILEKTANKRDIYRGPLNKHTIITYRLKPAINQIQIISFRSAKQKPLKRFVNS